MTAQLGVVVIGEAFDGRLLDGAVHPFDLAAIQENDPPDRFLILTAPGMPDLGQPMFDAVFFTAHVEHMGHPCRRGAVGVTRRKGEPDPAAIGLEPMAHQRRLGENRVDLVRNGLDQRDEEGRGGGSRRFRLQPDKGEFACPINANEEIEPIVGKTVPRTVF